MEKVLIVEDDEIIQKLIEYRLIALGYNVCAKADTGEDAVFCAMNTHPDVILMDINLKGPVDGIDAAKIIRKSLSPSIIFLTAYSDDETLIRAKAVHPDGFIQKPFNDTDLRVALTLARGDSNPSLTTAH
jgi:two-component system, response regulator PdtaR